MKNLEVVASLWNGGEEGEFMGFLIETLNKIAVHEDINNLLENVVFVFHSIPAMTKGVSRPVVITFNFSSLKQDIEKTGGTYEERVKDIIAHECAHYFLKNYNNRPSSEIEKETDDLIEKWGFNRAYTK
jgi:hypothetical protein